MSSFIHNICYLSFLYLTWSFWWEIYKFYWFPPPPRNQFLGVIDIFPIMLYFLLFSLYDCSQLNFFFKFFFFIVEAWIATGCCFSNISQILICCIYIVIQYKVVSSFLWSPLSDLWVIQNFFCLIFRYSGIWHIYLFLISNLLSL